MVEVGGIEYGSGYILFAASYDDEAVEEAKLYCRKHGLTPKTVRIKKTYKKENPDNYELVLVEVI